MWSSTQRDINPKSYICTNPECSECQPGYASTELYGKRARVETIDGVKIGVCHQCGKPLLIIGYEPRD